MFLAHLGAHRHKAALAEAQRAIDINSNFAFGHFALGWVRLFMGHFEQALDPLFRALRLSPSDPLAFFNLSRISLVHYHLGNGEEALHFAERAVAVRRMHIVLISVVASLGKLGRAAEAKPLLAELHRLEPPDLAGYWRVCFPYADPAHRSQLHDGLRRAGMAIGD